MRKKYLILCFIGLLPFLAKAQEADKIVKSALQALGGVDTWENLEFIKSSQISHKYWLEQSENPDGPFITSYDESVEIRAIHADKLVSTSSSKQFVAGGFTDVEIRIDEKEAMMMFRGRGFPMPDQFRAGYDERRRYSPDYLLLSALSQEKKLEGELEVEGTVHYHISFSKDDLIHHLFINKHTRTLTKAQIESFQPYDVFNYPWGKYLTTIKYSLYWLHKGGFRYPAQWDIYKLDKPYISITFLKISFNDDISKDAFEVPDSLANLPKRPASLVNDIPFPKESMNEISKGVHFIPGMWNVGSIVQKDGIVIIEAPISSGYNKAHLDFIRTAYPDKKIKAVISSSDAWPHVGGIREFVAQQIPIYTHKLNREIIQKILDADHSIYPDSLQKSHKNPVFNLVSEVISIEDPNVPIKLIPVNGEGGERMTAIYFPKQKLLYTCDLVQYANPRSKTFFAHQYLTEVKDLVERHELEVETVFAMHMTPIPWQDVLDALIAFKE